MELISIIVPVYKAEKYLCECIDSILSQTYENFELILVDDGSPDNSGKICDEYAEKDKRIKVIHKENGGVSSARNMGLDNANGEYITFIDSDDVVDKQYLELMYNKLVETHSDICFCKMESFVETINDKVKNDSFEIFDVSDNNKNKFIIDFFGGKYDYSSCGILYDRAIISNVRFNESIKNNEDFLFTLNCLLNCNRVSLISNVLYNYRINTSSVTKNYIKNFFEQSVAVYNELDELYKNNQISKKCLDIYACRSSYFLVNNELKYKNPNYKEKIKEIKSSLFYKQFKLRNIFSSFPRFLSKVKVSLLWIKIKLHIL